MCRGETSGFRVYIVGWGLRKGAVAPTKNRRSGITPRKFSKYTLKSFNISAFWASWRHPFISCIIVRVLVALATSRGYEPPSCPLDFLYAAVSRRPFTDSIHLSVPCTKVSDYRRCWKAAAVVSNISLCLLLNVSVAAGFRVLAYTDYISSLVFVLYMTVSSAMRWMQLSIRLLDTEEKLLFKQNSMF